MMTCGSNLLMVSALMNFYKVNFYFSLLDKLFYNSINSIMTIDSSTISLYTIPIILGIAGSILLTSYYILSKRKNLL
jgi:hypothetical protein